MIDRSFRVGAEHAWYRAGSARLDLLVALDEFCASVGRAIEVDVRERDAGYVAPDPPMPARWRELAILWFGLTVYAKLHHTIRRKENRPRPGGRVHPSYKAKILSVERADPLRETVSDEARLSILNPEPGTAIQRARDYGIDLTILLRNITLSSQEPLDNVVRAQSQARMVRRIREGSRRRD